MGWQRRRKGSGNHADRWCAVAMPVGSPEGRRRRAERENMAGQVERGGEEMHGGVEKNNKKWDNLVYSRRYRVTQAWRLYFKILLTRTECF